ncbi:NADH-quinone oxidoreductase subunit C [Motilibacter deserti]|uniref:NADH-quinone oxidoreductase n=1 Tax=Motilibacter deserti TaxID=2714956 RepID=A0ABX0H2J9_9ACTN|nr:NADH-quinone oxidoreductase subunit C [Motilibacter deserti]NHC16010.1 NADH-quinone oxidoreductase subunit C [Motilibacter deserti]
MSAPFEEAVLRAVLEPALGEGLLEVGTATGTAYADIAPHRWHDAVGAARDGLGLAWFDWLAGVDELEEGLRVVVSLLAPDGAHRGHGVLLRTLADRSAPQVPSLVDLFAGAAWHEREAHEMFGIDFAGHPGLRPLLLPDGFDGHPLRKDFVLASRVARPWPGEHEPSGRSRRRNLPPGVPEPGTWGAGEAGS